MMKQAIFSILILAAAALFWFANLNYPNIYLENAFYTSIAVAVLYILKSLAEESVSRNIKEKRAKYSFKKMVYLFYLIFLMAALMTIWIENPEALLVAYGLIAAGIAISLQDIFKNAAGGVLIHIIRPYRIGDRIEISGKYGDVMDIGIMYTTIMEIKGWVYGDQVTGRISIIPNSNVLAGTVNNYTKDHNFIWDEITMPITYDSDWKSATDKILEIAKRETKDIITPAERELSKLGDKYYLEKRATQPEIYVKMIDNWIEFSLRYITEARKRRRLNNRISKLILEEIQKSKNIKIASQTIDIVGFPKGTLKAK